ncbi:MAG: hypothetical protein ACRDJK_12470, partial [Actinomycetota bacterium]
MARRWTYPQGLDGGDTDHGERPAAHGEGAIIVVADTAYGCGASRRVLIDAGAALEIKAPHEQNTTGEFLQSSFVIDMQTQRGPAPQGTPRPSSTRACTAGAVPVPRRGVQPLPAAVGVHGSLKGRLLEVGPHPDLPVQARGPINVLSAKISCVAIRTLRMFDGQTTRTTRPPGRTTRRHSETTLS